jgi:hypothetical protein
VTPTLHRTLSRLAVRLTSSNDVGARVTAAPGPLAALAKKPQRCTVRTGKENYLYLLPAPRPARRVVFEF